MMVGVTHDMRPRSGMPKALLANTVRADHDPAGAGCYFRKNGVKSYAV